MARYWIVVGGPEIYATTRDMGFVRHGFKSTRRNMANSIAPGDMLAFYITGKKQFAATARVTGSVVEDHTRIWQSSKKPNELYPYRVTIEPATIVDESGWLDAEPYHDRFEWTRKWPRQHWTLAYQGNLHEIPKDDFELLQKDLEKAAKAAPAGTRS
ncbi:MAG: EVE domain-containing protein [Dehalococcoidia bacterium]